MMSSIYSEHLERYLDFIGAQECEDLKRIDINLSLVEKLLIYFTDKSSGEVNNNSDFERVGFVSDDKKSLNIYVRDDLYINMIYQINIVDLDSLVCVDYTWTYFPDKITVDNFYALKNLNFDHNK